jgi:Flp pilus assembly protein TadD
VASVQRLRGQIEPSRAALEKTVKGQPDAEQLIARAATSAPTDPQIRYHLSAVYAKLGKKAQARRELEQALKTPTFPEATEARKALDALR